MANAIRHRRDDDNPTWWVGRYLKNNWEYQDESKTIFRSVFFAKAIVKRATSQDAKTTDYDVARDGVDRSVAAGGT